MSFVLNWWKNLQGQRISKKLSEAPCDKAMLKQENVKLILHLLWEVNGINQDKNCEDERIFKSVVAKLMENFTKILVTEYLFLWQLKGTFTKFLEQFGTNNENSTIVFEVSNLMLKKLFP